MKTGKGGEGLSEGVETQSACHHGLDLFVLLVEAILGIRGQEIIVVFCLLGIWRVEWINDCGQRKRKRDVEEEKEGGNEDSPGTGLLISGEESRSKEGISNLSLASTWAPLSMESRAMESRSFGQANNRGFDPLLSLASMLAPSSAMFWSPSRSWTLYAHIKRFPPARCIFSMMFPILLFCPLCQSPSFSLSFSQSASEKDV